MNDRRINPQVLDLPPAPGGVCPRLWSGLTISAGGAAYVCCMTCTAACNEGLRVGDARAQTLREIVSGPAIRRLRERHLRGDLDGTCCAHCSGRRAAGPGGEDADPARLLRFVEVEITDRCNQRCVMCHRTTQNASGRPLHPGLEAAGDMDPALFEKIRGELVALNQHPKEIRLQWLGEPLLHPRFVDLLRAAASDPSTVPLVITNGLLMDGPTCDAVTSIPGLMRVEFSLNAASARTHRALTGTEGYDRAALNVERFLVLRRQKRREDEIAVRIKIIVLPETAGEVRSFITHWGKLLDRLGARHAVWWENAGEPLPTAIVVNALALERLDEGAGLLALVRDGKGTVDRATDLNLARYLENLCTMQPAADTLADAVEPLCDFLERTAGGVPPFIGFEAAAYRFRRALEQREPLGALRPLTAALSTAGLRAAAGGRLAGGEWALLTQTSFQAWSALLDAKMRPGHEIIADFDAVLLPIIAAATEHAVHAPPDFPRALHGYLSSASGLPQPAWMRAARLDALAALLGSLGDPGPFRETLRAFTVWRDLESHIDRWSQGFQEDVTVSFLRQIISELGGPHDPDHPGDDPGEIARPLTPAEAAWLGWGATLAWFRVDEPHRTPAVAGAFGALWRWLAGIIARSPALLDDRATLRALFGFLGATLPVAQDAAARREWIDLLRGIAGSRGGGPAPPTTRLVSCWASLAEAFLHASADPPDTRRLDAALNGVLDAATAWDAGAPDALELARAAFVLWFDLLKRTDDPGGPTAARFDALIFDLCRIVAEAGEGEDFPEDLSRAVHAYLAFAPALRQDDGLRAERGARLEALGAAVAALPQPAERPGPRGLPLGTRLALWKAAVGVRDAHVAARGPGAVAAALGDLRGAVAALSSGSLSTSQRDRDQVFVIVSPIELGAQDGATARALDALYNAIGEAVSPAPVVPTPGFAWEEAGGVWVLRLPEGLLGGKAAVRVIGPWEIVFYSTEIPLEGAVGVSFDLHALHPGVYRFEVTAGGVGGAINYAVTARRPREIYGLAAMAPRVTFADGRLETAGEVHAESGGPLSIAMPYALPPHVARPQFGIGVVAADGHVVHGPSTALLGAETRGCPRAGAVTFSTERTALLPGRYRVIGGVFNEGGEICYSFSEEVCTIVVTGPALPAGIIDLRAAAAPPR